MKEAENIKKNKTKNPPLIVYSYAYIVICLGYGK
jgi:hypothetical protein